MTEIKRFRKTTKKKDSTNSKNTRSSQWKGSLKEWTDRFKV